MGNKRIVESSDRPHALETLILFGVTGILFSCVTLSMWVVNLLSLDTLLGMAYNWPWYLSRSTALVAYLLMTGSVVWGLVLSMKIVKQVTPPALAMSIHRFISWLALTFAGLHAYLLLFDRYYLYRLWDILIPFVGPYKPLAVGLGVGTFWVFLGVAASFSVKKQIGHSLWRVIHQLSFPGFLVLTLHGLLAGTDSGNPGMLLIYAACGGIVALLTFFRVLSSLGLRARPAHAA
jgi:predicted ferric reductase